jgi:hypothetical protein
VGLRTSAIAGIGVGVGVGILAFAVIAILFWRHKKHNATRAAEPGTSALPGPPVTYEKVSNVELDSRLPALESGGASRAELP